ncbi:GlxA family transcriptional regulator [Paracoccus sp. MKU1]|uniref:GlxA family transcriptional regulator n=1 Tax=Paracoccus sp. MKU1 TaxID=1745182 RepID=UPI00071933B4|nr:helix-turn-helix domain-containing protein [Paracoccus sp. MKU1]KRW97786.1 hypothetical protein AQY21_01645 [Paracoccus sp. MKU1]
MVQPIFLPSPGHGLPYLKVGVLLCPDFTLTPMASFVDTLRLAADRSDGSRQIYFSWDFLAAGAGPPRSSCGLEVKPTAALSERPRYDCLVVCGGLLRKHSEILPETYEYLRAEADRRIPIVGLCSGSFVMARSGLLDGRRCALHFEVFEEFVRSFPNVQAVSDENFVSDGPFITCPGGFAAVEVAAQLVAAYGETSRAEKAMSFLLFKPGEPRIVLKTKPYAEALARASQLTVNAVRAMEFGIDAPCSIDSLARSLNATRARLNRAFAEDLQTSPAAFWRDMRMLASRELLLNRRRTVTEIAYDLGFCDAAHFCTAFKRYFGISPLEYRLYERKTGKAPVPPAPESASSGQHPPAATT